MVVGYGYQEQQNWTDALRKVNILFFGKPQPSWAPADSWEAEAFPFAVLEGRLLIIVQTKSRVDFTLSPSGQEAQCCLVKMNVSTATTNGSCIRFSKLI